MSPNSVSYFLGNQMRELRFMGPGDRAFEWRRCRRIWWSSHLPAQIKAELLADWSGSRLILGGLELVGSRGHESRLHVTTCNERRLHVIGRREPRLHNTARHSPQTHLRSSLAPTSLLRSLPNTNSTRCKPPLSVAACRPPLIPVVACHHLSSSRTPPCSALRLPPRLVAAPPLAPPPFNST